MGQLQVLGSFAVGSLALNINLELYGVDLPEIPVNGVHYLGVDFDKPEPVIDLIRDEPERLAKIAAEGRRWALEHYSSVATARRLLAHCGVEIEPVRNPRVPSSPKSVAY